MRDGHFAYAGARAAYPQDSPVHRKCPPLRVSVRGASRREAGRSPIKIIPLISNAGTLNTVIQSCKMALLK